MDTDLGDRLFKEKLDRNRRHTRFLVMDGTGNPFDGGDGAKVMGFHSDGVETLWRSLWQVLDGFSDIIRKNRNFSNGRHLMEHDITLETRLRGQGCWSWSLSGRAQAYDPHPVCRCPKRAVYKYRFCMDFRYLNSK